MWVRLYFMTKAGVEIFVNLFRVPPPPLVMHEALGCLGSWGFGGVFNPKWGTGAKPRKILKFSST